MTNNEINSELSPFNITIAKTGSNYICTPPVEDTDIDFVILCSTLDWEKIQTHLQTLGYTTESYITKPSNEKDSIFVSYRKGKINYIITCFPNLFSKFIIATSLAKSLNLQSKQQRITLFQYILYNTLARYEEV